MVADGLKQHEKIHCSGTHGWRGIYIYIYTVPDAVGLVPILRFMAAAGKQAMEVSCAIHVAPPVGLANSHTGGC